VDNSWSLVTFSGEQGLVEEAQKALEEAEALKKVLILCLLGLFNDEFIGLILYHCAVLKYFYLPLSSFLFVSYFNSFVIAILATCPAGACSRFLQVHCCWCAHCKSFLPWLILLFVNINVILVV
jgi:hypothetical protein